MRASAAVTLVAVVAVAVAGCAGGAAAGLHPTILTPTAKVVRSFTTQNTTSTLSALSAGGYDSPIMLLHIKSDSHYSAGYSYGALLGNQSVENYKALVDTELPNAVEQDLAMKFIDHLYKTIEKGLPSAFLAELAGIEAAGVDFSVANLGLFVKRGLTITSLLVDSELFDVLHLLLPSVEAAKGLSLAERAALVASVADKLTHSRLFRMGGTCSMFGVWGSRTVDGRLRTGRNLDWIPDTGASKNRVITVYSINGTHPYATVGLAGVISAFAGISERGLTVHEAGDDNKKESLEGFAWGLRLRALMETADDLASAMEFWNSTGNTMGLNHGVGSAKDNAFAALETVHGYTAFFQANDPREDVVEGATHYGRPLPEALWRTNHAYDAGFLENAATGYANSPDSLTRYMLIHDTIQDYNASGTRIGDLQAINITAIPGDKGGSRERPSFLTCADAKGGDNIVSAMFVPKVGGGLLYAAFENGHAATHSPACCNPYIRLDLAPLFAA